MARMKGEEKEVAMLKTYFCFFLVVAGNKDYFKYSCEMVRYNVGSWIFMVGRYIKWAKRQIMQLGRALLESSKLQDD